MLFQFKQHEQWVKTVLISDIVEPNWRVCELCCGKGLDLGRWTRAKISHFVGVEPNQVNLEEAKSRWLQKKKPFTAEFLNHDPKTDDLTEAFSLGEPFDVIASFEGFQNSFESEARAAQFIKNVANHLKKGGYFFGLVPDSSAIWDRAQKQSKDSKALFSMEFPSDYTFPFFGSSYRLKIEDVLHEESTEFLVHFPTLIKMCAENGLEVLEICNLLEFYEDNRRNYYDRLKELKVLLKHGKLDPAQRDLIGMYTTFVFQKTN